MAHPHAEAKAFLESTAIAAMLPAGTTRGTTAPTGPITGFHIQYAWDGTPTDADNRENTVLRMTVWIPKGQGKEIAGANLAAELRARLLAWSSANTWRVDRGVGRLIGVDPATQLPFCTFTVGLVLHATPAT